MRTLSCRKCGLKISDQYSFCPHCLAPTVKERVQRITRKRGRVQEPVPTRSSRHFIGRRVLESLEAWFGPLNLHEEYFVYAFLLSIIAGIVIGSLGTTIYNSESVQTRMTAYKTPFAIFLHNFSVDLLSVATGGVLIFLSNAITFSTISRALVGQRVGIQEVLLLLAIAFGTYGTLEMAGHLLFSLAGFTYLEKILWKQNTHLRRDRLLMLATGLVFVAAVIEWYLLVLIPRHPP